MRSLLPLLLVIFLFKPSIQPLQAQHIHPERYVTVIRAGKIMEHVYFLADTLFRGRECGSPYSIPVTTYLEDRFYDYNIKPMKWRYGYRQSFRIDSNRICRNVIGEIRGRTKPDEYVILSAHYDHLGALQGKIYPGADDNASGVAALLSVAHAMSSMARNGEGPQRSVLFVLYDGKEYSMAGSAYFAANLTFPYKNIIANINLNQIGTTLAPPGSQKAYLLVVGADRAGKGLPQLIRSNNDFYGIGLHLDFTFYQSKTFADVFFQITDQYALAKHGVPSALFTAGINDYTYKPGDTPDIIDPDVLEQRARLAFYVVWDLANRSTMLR